MKHIITLILLLFIITACTKNEKQNEKISDTQPKEQVEKAVDNITDNVTDNITDNTKENVTENIIEKKQLPEIEYIYKTTVEMPDALVPLNKVDIDQLLSKHYETDTIKLMRKSYEADQSYKVLEDALVYGYFDIADELLKGVTLDAYLKNLIIGSVAKSGKIENMKYLEKYNISVSEDLNDSVIQVYKYGRNEFLAYNMVEYLLQNKADPNIPDDANTALSLAWNKASFDLLLKYGADVDFIVYLGDGICGSYLLDTAVKGEKAKVDYLLSLDANPFAPVAWDKTKYASVTLCRDIPKENIGSLYNLADNIDLGDIYFDKNMTSEYRESIKTYSKKYMVDAYANIAETDMSEAPFWVHGENAETADDYMAQFEVSDFFKNEYLISNAYILSKNLMLYPNNKKTPYLYTLLNSRIANKDHIHISSAVAYISVLISNGFNMGEDTKDTNVLDYIFSQFSQLDYNDTINYVSSYIYREGQDKKEAVNKLMAAVKKVGITPEHSYTAEYIYKMYEKYNK